MKYLNSIQDGEVIAFADASLFTKEAILKCTYWYGDKFHVNISLIDGQVYLVSLKVLSSVSLKMNELEYFLEKLGKDLIDYQLRDIISKETKNVRDLLIAKAFSNGDFDEDPSSNVGDPLGFNPNEVK